MKTKTIIKQAMVLLIVSTLSIVSGCKKDKTNEVTNPDTSSLQQLAKDDAQVQASDNEITNDANAVLSSSSKAIDTTISSCVITDTVIGDTIQYTLVYNGYITVHNFKKTGTVIIKKLNGVPWKTAGTTVTFEYLHLAVTKITSGKIFIFNGTRKFENVSGGLIMDLGTSVTSVKHQITGAMQVTFEDGTTRTWYIFRTRTWAGTFPSALTLTVSGFGTEPGYSNLVEWGTNRNGELFYTSISPSTPILYSETCSWDPIWGTLVHQIPAKSKSATITFGYNSSDVLVTEGNCADFYKLDWVVGTRNGTLYLPLP